ncbi:hypothetical protein M9H77_22887 [Catharanthus roseus]|uniref:Uncharacterized protein n=1 Tax=Catharanthus roseus TaxID=4058 RepID=A0ACC0ARQ7_CATRO|nr:hypothetical protein M9H77_22887 [Catharanthus roseus]
MEAIQKSHAASLHNIEKQIELLPKIIVEEPFSNIPSNTVTLWDEDEQEITFPMFMDDKDDTAQELKESTSQGFKEPLLNASKVEESKKDECLPENKDGFEESEPQKENEKFVENHEGYKEGRQETELDDIEKSEGVNLHTNETNFVLVDDSLCMQESCKWLKENNGERRPLMEFKENFENAKREQSLCYEKAQMSFSSTFTLINLLSSFKELRFYRISRFLQDLFSWIQELKILFQDFDIRIADSRDDLRRPSGFNCGFNF